MKKKKEFTKKQLKNKLTKCITEKHIFRGSNILLKNKKKK
tara:strand:- start:1788 stop:1907 length:120 start_codon:yes stop_codon:yes gene_type:complete